MLLCLPPFTGACATGAVEDTPLEAVRDLMALNYFGHVYATTKLLPQLRAAAALAKVSTRMAVTPRSVDTCLALVLCGCSLPPGSAISSQSTLASSACVVVSCTNGGDKP